MPAYRKEAPQYPQETEIEFRETQESPGNIQRLKSLLISYAAKDKVWVVGIHPAFGTVDPYSQVGVFDKFKFGVGYPDAYDISFIFRDEVLNGFPGVIINPSQKVNSGLTYDNAKEINMSIARHHHLLTGENIQRVACLKFPSVDTVIKKMSKAGKRWIDAANVAVRMVDSLFEQNETFTLQYTVLGLDIELATRFTNPNQDPELPRQLRIYASGKNANNQPVRGPVSSFINTFQTHFE